MSGLKNKHFVPVALIICFLSLFSFTQKVIAQGGPPLITDDPGTPEAGHWEINLAAIHERTRDQSTWEAPLVDISYGASDHIQLKFEVPWTTSSTKDEPAKSGLGNSELGLKWRFLDEDLQGIAMSTYPQIELENPTSSTDRGVSEKGKQVLLPIEMERKIGPLNADLEFGYRFKEFESNEWIYGVAAGYPLSEKLEVLGELHGTLIESSGKDELLVNFGIRYNFHKNSSLLFSVGRDLRSADEEVSILSYLGIQFRL